MCRLHQQRNSSTDDRKHLHDVSGVRGRPVIFSIRELQRKRKYKHCKQQGFTLSPRPTRDNPCKVSGSSTQRALRPGCNMDTDDSHRDAYMPLPLKVFAKRSKCLHRVSATRHRIADFDQEEEALHERGHTFMDSRVLSTAS